MKRWATLGGGIAVAALAVDVALILPVTQWASQLVAWMREAGAIGVLGYAVVYVGAAVLLLPGAALTAAAGLVYGPWHGLVLVSPVSVAAAVVAFVLGRTIARGWIRKRTDTDPRFRAIDRAIKRHGLKLVILLRLSPLFPFSVMNYALGLTSVSLRHYVVGSFVGMLPGTFLYVYIGSLVGDLTALSQHQAGAETARQVVSLLGFVATITVTVFVTRLARRALADELRDSDGATAP